MTYDAWKSTNPADEFLGDKEQLTWQDHYERYLQTPTWAEKRRMVLRRAHGICEGCGVHNASEVHHLKPYPPGWPGSKLWIRHEKLFLLVALCPRCHQDLHPRTSK